MNLQQLETPAILVRSQVMRNNLETYQAECCRFHKELWPMVKTHKSLQIAAEQSRLGAEGFLCGTLDECEALAKAGYSAIMYAYPVADAVSCARVAALAQQCRFYTRIDSLEAASNLNNAAAAADVTVNYTIIIDCGLHRFGIAPEKAVAFADSLSALKHLRFCGISTHAGHVYGGSSRQTTLRCANEELQVIHTAVDALRAAGYTVELVSTGSTPTFWEAVQDDYVNICHPGNYIFNDCIQVANGTAAEEDCALLVYTSVISHPSEDMLICDAGAKCLGLDTGAHGNTALQGHGIVLGHPELTVIGLSEEVGKLRIHGQTDIKVGDRILIIPNHSCSSANLTSHYVMVNSKWEVEGTIPVDIRSNSTTKRVL